MTKAPALSRSALSTPWAFFVVVLGWSWFFWLLAVLLGLSINTVSGKVLGLLGLLGPALGGIGFTYLAQGGEGSREYWVRMIDPKRIPAKWYLVIFLFVPVLMAVAAALDIFSGESAATFEKGFAPFLSKPFAIIPLAFSTFFIGPLPEELGWRGYALDRLLARSDALVSSLILGAVWALWHFPLFLIRDTYQYNLGVWSPSFWLFMIGIIPVSVIFTWIFNNCRRSTLAAILFHFMVVFTDVFLNVTIRTDVYSTLLWIIAAIIVTITWGGRTLTGRGAFRAERSEHGIPRGNGTPG